MKIKDYINKVSDKSPIYPFTGNLFRLYPELLEYAPLSENSRLRLILTPSAASWWFVTPQGQEFNFYPIWLKITSERAGINYTSISYKLNLRQSANIHHLPYQVY